MTHEGQLIRLKRLTHDIVVERHKLMGDPPAPHTAAHTAMSQKIDSWSHIFEELSASLGRSLKSRSHLNHMIYQQQRFSPNAYSARQSFQSKQSNIRDVAAALSNLEEALRDLIETFYAGQPAEIAAMEAFSDVVTNWLERVKHTEDGIMGPVPVELQTAVVKIYDSAPASGKPSVPLTVVDIVTLLLAYFVLLKSLNNRG
ncbi:hypothetical protein ACG74X_07015 [Marivita sp. S0852]|uniref:hypothetical protein n=1 Tax=Marivita sp. S0852 TaxID=3373893 RepID=UPI0039823E9E